MCKVELGGQGKNPFSWNVHDGFTSNKAPETYMNLIAISKLENNII